MKPTIAECRLHVLPLMEAINKAASEWETAPLEILRPMVALQEQLEELIEMAVDSEHEKAWAWRDNQIQRKEEVEA